MINHTKDYISKLYLILIVFILVLIVCCIIANPATAFALDDKNTANGTIVLSDVVQNEGRIELKGYPEKIGKITDAHYIKNYKYFVNSPKHKINDGSDNDIGTCTTVAMQLMLGYHTYYTDRRLITNVEGHDFLSNNFGQLQYNPLVFGDDDFSFGYDGNGNLFIDGAGALGTEDLVYQEIYNRTPLGDTDIGQNFVSVNIGTRSFLSEYSVIANQVDINFSLSYNKEEVVEELDAHRPIILGTKTLSEDGEKSYHVVIAYGYALYEGKFGYICNMGWNTQYSMTWVPEDHFHFQNIVRINHEHTLVDQQVNIENAYRHFKCSECNCDILDDLYEVSADGNTIISLKYDPLPDTVLPQIINGKNITGVAKNAFKGTSISSIDLGKCTYLGEGVFENCTLLSKVVFPTGLTMTYIPDNCFKGCSNLSMITLPSTVTDIGRAAFEDCSNLTAIGNIIHLVNLGAFAFRNCTNLNSFTGNKKLSLIGQGAFAGCNNCDINVVGGNENFCSEGNIVYNKDKTTIFASGKTASVFDFSAIRTIAPSAFESNNRVTKLVFDQVDIGDRAFYDCSNISEVYFDAFSVQQFGTDCFGHDSFTVYVPYYLQGDYAYLITESDSNIRSRQFNVTYFDSEIEVATQTHYYGELIFRLPVLTRTGYTFVGWHKRADLADEIVLESDDAKWQEKSDVALYAEWDANTYTITFDGIGCESLGIKNVLYNEKIGELPIPNRIGYEFIGWKNENNDIVSAGDLYLTVGNTLLFATWREKTYTITFHACGGTPEIQSVQCVYNEIIDVFPSVERDGYSLSAWNSMENGTGEYYNSGFAYAYDGHLDLYAQWDIVTYSIVYVLDGGINNASNPVVYTIENEDIILNPATKLGYSFVGWMKVNSIISKIDNGSFGNIELIAIWQANMYTITLNANGGVLQGDNSFNVLYDDDFKIPNVVSRVGYILDGWFNGVDDNSNKYADTNGNSVKKWDKAQDDILYARWSIKSYEIQINNDETITWLGPNGLSTEKGTINYGSIIEWDKFENAFKNTAQGYKEGHIFDHFEYNGAKIEWDNIPDLGNNGNIISINPVWKEEEYTILFETGFKQFTSYSRTFKYNDICTFETKDVLGYDFNGWSQSENGEPVSWTTIPDLSPNEQKNAVITMYAIFTPIEYTITYVTFDGVNAQENPSTYNITQNIIFAYPSKIGYIFDGWFSDSAFSTKVNSITETTGNITLYAKWMPIKYKICYHANDGTSILETSNHEYNLASKLRANTFVKQGYSFIGWATSENGTTQYCDCDNVLNLSVINNDIIHLYAVWTANNYQIKYIANGGYGTMPNSSHMYDKSYYLDKCQYERRGYSFVGWALSASGEKVYTDGDSVMNLTSSKNGVVSLYASWEPNTYTITFDMQGGNGGTSTIAATYDADLPDIIPPERNGYIFKGYFDGKQANGKQYYKTGNPSKGVSKYDKTSDVTLYAFWEKQYYDITVYNEDDTVFKVIQVAFGDQMPEFAVFAPKKNGYTFNGYYSEKDGKGIKYYSMEYRNDEQTAMIEGTNYHYCEQIDSCRKMDQYKGFSLYPSFSSLELDYTYSIYCDSKVIATHNIHVSGKNKSTTVSAPSVNGYSFSHFLYGMKQYSNSTSTIPFTLRRSNSDSDGRVKLGNVFSAVYTKNQDSCVAPGTLITLADGTQVPVETLTGNERLLVWNMLTGSFDSAPIVFVDSEPLGVRDIINLGFSDGTIVRVISEHAFWDIDLNQYIYLDENAGQYIGHHFNKQIIDDNGNMMWDGVQLTSVAITQEETTAWSPVTYKHLCYYVNGMLSIPGGISGLFNYLSVDSETMTINQEALAEDIEQYGVFTYEEFSELVTITPEVFDAFNGQYLKIAMGKGMITIDEIQSLLNRYARFF